MFSDASVKPAANAKLNTETPGSSVDRLSIMSPGSFTSKNSQEGSSSTRPTSSRVRSGRVAGCSS